MTHSRKRFVGRGAQIRPDNRFAPLRREECALDVNFDAANCDAGGDAEDVVSPFDPPPPTEMQRVPTVYLPDESVSVVTENQSPDLPFRYSLNPYRGCAHGCAYCYARPTHEYLGLDAGLDFESKILVKHRAPDLFRAWLRRGSYVCEPVMFSGVTDCYQPAERQFSLTRACLAVAAEANQPITIITKNSLVTRDLDLLQTMSERRQVQVAVSITTLDQQLAQVMEPRTSCPAARLAALTQLREAGVPTQVVVAPVIPGMNDHEIPAILQAARDHGADACGYVLLRLPLNVRPVFLDWLERTLPWQAERVKARIRSVRAGAWNDAQFGRRQRGSGPIAEQIGMTFKVFARRFGYADRLPELNTADFLPLPSSGGQRWLF